MEDITKALGQVPLTNKSKRLTSLWPAIEAKLANGASHAAIVEALNQCGFGITVQTFRTLLYRHRRKHGASTGMVQRPQVVAPEVSPLPADTQRPATFDYDPRGIHPDLLK